MLMLTCVCMYFLLYFILVLHRQSITQLDLEYIVLMPSGLR